MQVRKPTRRRLAAIAGACALGAALTACGGDSSGTESSSSSSSAGGSGSAAEGGTTAVTVVRSTGATFEGLYIAEEQGFFDEAGLDVTINPGAPDTAQNVPIVIKGEAQFGMTDIGGITKAVAQGLPVQTVVQIQAAQADVPVTDGILVPADSDIQSPKDLAGKKVGIAALGGNIQMITMAAVRDDGGDPKAVQFVALPVASLQDAAEKGQVDAISSFAAFYDTAKAAGMRAVGTGSNGMPGNPQSLIFSSTEWLADNAETATKFIEAFSKGLEYANENPDDIRAVDAEYTQMSAEDIANRTIQTFDPTFDVAGVANVLKNFSEFGITTNEITTDQLIWSQAPTD